MANLTINDGGIVTNKPGMPSIDLRYGPFLSKAEAEQRLASVATRGLTVGIWEEGEIVEYWFKNVVSPETGESHLMLVKKITDLKTIDGNSLLGDGNVDIEFSDGKKVSELAVDAVPTQDSENLITSGGVADLFQILQEQIQDISKDVYPLTIAFSADQSSPIPWEGTDINLILIWTTTIDDEEVVPSRVKIVQDGVTTIYDERPTTATDHVPAVISREGETVFSIEAELETQGMTQRRNLSIIVTPSSYIGFYTSNTTDLATMKGSLSPRMIDEVKDLSGSYVLEDGQPAAYLTIAIPYRFTIDRVLSDGGFEVPFSEAEIDRSVNIDGNPEVYKVYRSINKILPGTMKIRVE